MRDERRPGRVEDSRGRRLRLPEHRQGQLRQAVDSTDGIRRTDLTPGRSYEFFYWSDRWMPAGKATLRMFRIGAVESILMR